MASAAEQHAAQEQMAGTLSRQMEGQLAEVRQLLLLRRCGGWVSTPNAKTAFLFGPRQGVRWLGWSAAMATGAGVCLLDEGLLRSSPIVQYVGVRFRLPRWCQQRGYLGRAFPSHRSQKATGLRCWGSEMRDDKTIFLGKGCQHQWRWSDCRATTQAAYPRVNDNVF